METCKEPRIDRTLREFGDFPYFTTEKAYFNMLEKSKKAKKEVRDSLKRIGYSQDCKLEVFI